MRDGGDLRGARMGRGILASCSRAGAGTAGRATARSTPRRAGEGPPDALPACPTCCCLELPEQQQSGHAERRWTRCRVSHLLLPGASPSNNNRDTQREHRMRDRGTGAAGLGGSRRGQPSATPEDVQQPGELERPLAARRCSGRSRRRGRRPSRTSGARRPRPRAAARPISPARRTARACRSAR